MDKDVILVKEIVEVILPFCEIVNVVTLDIITPQRPKQSTKFGGGRAYTPSKIQQFEYEVRKASSEYMHDKKIEMWEGPVALMVNFKTLIPKSYPKKNPPKLNVKRPDTTNLIKSVEDGMNQIVFRDDSQIVMSIPVKHYDDSPGIKVQALFLNEVQ